MRVPILRIPFAEPDKDRIGRDIREVLTSGMLSGGRFTARFEELFAQLAAAPGEPPPYALSCSNGTTALELILRGLGIRGRSVIVPTNTFMATALAAMNAGNHVIFADSDPATFGLCPRDVRRRLRDDTAAVMTVHIGGIVSPQTRELQALCAERGIALIEDCAHAHGSSYDGVPAGAFGIAGGFSFFPTKVLTTGEGGMIVTRDAELARRIGILRNQGKDPAHGHHVSMMGGNYRISELTAVLGVEQMERALALIEGRRRAAALYDERLSGLVGARALAMPEGVRSTYYKYIVVLENGVDRARLKARVKDEYGVSLTGEVYADLCHAEPIWKSWSRCGIPLTAGGRCERSPSCGCGQSEEPFVGSEEIARSHVCLPLFPDLTEAEVDHVVASLRRALSEENTAS